MGETDSNQHIYVVATNRCMISSIIFVESTFFLLYCFRSWHPLGPLQTSKSCISKNRSMCCLSKAYFEAVLKNVDFGQNWPGAVPHKQSKMGGKILKNVFQIEQIDFQIRFQSFSKRFIGKKPFTSQEIAFPPKGSKKFGKNKFFTIKNGKRTSF